MRSDNILEIHDLDVFFQTIDGHVRAVNKVSFGIGKGECFGIIGETGSGKSVVGQAVLRLLPNNADVKGSVIFQEVDLLNLDIKEMKEIRGKRISLIPQNPARSLNPALKNGKQVIEIFDGKDMSLTEKKDRVVSVIKLLFLRDPEDIYASYPHQISGGMKQRLLASIALCSHPDLLIADEPTKGLDPDSLDKVCELFLHIKREHKRAMMIITHDIDFALRVCDRIAVMYSGEIVEINDVVKIMNSPLHPYTRGLMNALPRNGLIPLEGLSPSRLSLPDGCYFDQRCGFCSSICQCEHPIMKEHAGGMVRCHRY